MARIEEAGEKEDRKEKEGTGARVFVLSNVRNEFVVLGQKKKSKGNRMRSREIYDIVKHNCRCL